MDPEDIVITPREPIYSDDPEEERRMLSIRDNVANRTATMARSRVAVGRQHIRFNDTELQWISEETRWQPMIPVLSPNEYWSMILGLAHDLDRTRTELARSRIDGAR